MNRKINLGCGARFHSDWTNVDFLRTGKDVIVADLTKGIPFESGVFDAVYHSHVLEHFKQADAIRFLNECYRIMKPGGIIRVVVPDLEQIVVEYLNALSRSLKGEGNSEADYDWAMLELLDQIVRAKSGGQMAEYLAKPDLPNEEHIYKRLGAEARSIRKRLIEKRSKEQSGLVQTKLEAEQKQSGLRERLFRTLFRKEFENYKRGQAALEEMKFRNGGEIHQWMYDRFSLTRLLINSGFSSVSIRKADSSEIENWISYELDCDVCGMAHKPDSLFIEAKRPL